MIRAALIAVLLVTSPAVAQAAPATPADVAQRAIDGYIRPAFATFAAASADLERETATLCDDPSDASLAVTRAQFLHSIDAYSRIVLLRFGPLLSDNRLERLFLWPDPRGIALRQVQEFLAEKPDDVLDAAALKTKSVALQGFNALEFVLFGTGAQEQLTTPDGAYRCRYGASIATAIRTVADEMRDEWADLAGISARLAAPSSADPDYRTVTEVLEELVGTLAHGTEGVRDTMLLPLIGRDGEPKPRSAPLWRSNATIPLVAGSLLGVTEFVAASGIADPAGELGSSIAETIALEADNIRTAQLVLTGTTEELVADRGHLQDLRYLVIYTQQLQDLLGAQLAQALGLSVGFSALDGD